MAVWQHMCPVVLTKPSMVTVAIDISMNIGNACHFLPNNLIVTSTKEKDV